MIGKSSPAKFANFVYIRITRKSFNNLFVKSWFFPTRSTKIYEICKHPSPPKVAPYLLFSGLLIIKNASAKKISPRRKFGSIGGTDYINTGSFKKYSQYSQTLVRRTSSDFKTPQSSLKNTRLRLVFSTPLGV